MKRRKSISQAAAIVATVTGLPPPKGVLAGFLRRQRAKEVAQLRHALEKCHLALCCVPQTHEPCPGFLKELARTSINPAIDAARQALLPDRPMDVYAKLRRAYNENRGVKLTADDVDKLVLMDTAVTELTHPDRSDLHTTHDAAVELGRLGAAKGGKARAAKLSPKRRTAIARKAAKARWRQYWADIERRPW